MGALGLLLGFVGLVLLMFEPTVGLLALFVGALLAIEQGRSDREKRERELELARERREEQRHREMLEAVRKQVEAERQK